PYTLPPRHAPLGAAPPTQCHLAVPSLGRPIAPWTPPGRTRRAASVHPRCVVAYCPAPTRWVALTKYIGLSTFRWAVWRGVGHCPVQPWAVRHTSATRSIEPQAMDCQRTNQLYVGGGDFGTGRACCLECPTVAG